MLSMKPIKLIEPIKFAQEHFLLQSVLPLLLFIDLN